MIKNIILFAFLFAYSFASSSFVQQLKSDLENELSKERQRLSEFKADVSGKEERLKKIKEEFLEKKRLNDELKEQHKLNENLLKEKQSELKEKSGDLTNIFSNIRSASSKVYKISQNSLSKTSNLDLFTNISNQENLNSQHIKDFFLALIDEIVKSGFVDEFEAEVIDEKGKKKMQTINAIGKFSSFSEGKYLDFNSDLNSFIVLSKQPNFIQKGDIKNFSKKPIASVVTDVTGGSLFEMLENEATLMDKIKQGKIVGYVIIFLGVLGLLYAFYKIITLKLCYQKIKKQLKDVENPTNNPLGEIIKVFVKQQNKSINEIEAKMSEEIITQTNKIQSGKDFIKLLATITPLLGLLGTVTGMITTFEVITMFGTGDAKLMAGGISSALVTTVLGLVTAIPLLFAYSYLSSKMNVILAILEEQSIGMLAKSFRHENY